jgi:hypothetical protein
VRPADAAGSLTAILVLHESAAVVEEAIASLAQAAPRRGVQVVVVDNASTDDGAARAEARLPAGAVVRAPVNRGFAAGVNAGLARCTTEFVVLVNPDLRFAPGALDRLADFLEARPEVALVGPRVDLEHGGREATAGVFPTAARERVHAWFGDRLLGLPGRRRSQPEAPAAVDWVSGCAWMLRRSTAARVGPLDEGYFMYVEDVDYCRRLALVAAEVWVEPAARAVHARGTGSTRSALLPADGGGALVRWFERHAPHEREAARAALRQGWWLRLALHHTRAVLGHRGADRLAARYARALADTARG